MKISFFEHLHDIFLFKFIKVKIKNSIVNRKRGILIYSKFVRYVKTPLDTPKNKNKKAGKQHKVDNSAVITAPIKGK